MEVEYSIKHGLQKMCPHEVTWNNREKAVEEYNSALIFFNQKAED